MAIKRKLESGPVFTFNRVTKEDVIKEINNLDASKASQEDDIPTKIIKENSDIFSNFICQSFSNMIDVYIFPTSLKLANITPVYKKGSKNSKENYTPVSILPNISKIYERCLFKPISNYFENIFSTFQCGFRQGLSAQYCLISTTEQWKKSVDKGKTFAALLTDLSKAFDCLPHDLIIAKLNAYGFSLSAARLMQSYLCNRKQRTRINTAYSSWEEVLFGVPKGSIGPLLFNIFICNLFLIMNKVDFASYADNNTPYVIGNGAKEAINSLKEASHELFYWFANNQMKTNPDKCHLLTSSCDKVSICVDNNNIKSSK